MATDTPHEFCCIILNSANKKKIYIYIYLCSKFVAVKLLTFSTKSLKTNVDKAQKNKSNADL